jgi:phosphate transport system substrate-binding protein
MSSKVGVMLVGIVLLTGCNSSVSRSSGGNGAAAKAGVATKLSGSGSSFIKPIMDKWVSEYLKAHGGEINYQSQGSTAGIKQMTDKAVDFGCTDAFMKAEQLKIAHRQGGRVIEIPVTMGAIALAYNLEGLQKPLNFTGEVLADIYLGKLKKWNDDRLKQINQGVDLPDRDIGVVHRADSSGSTNIFTEFLSKVSPEWATRVGASTSVKWPCGIGENQTAGVAGFISKNPGSIGYIELFYALQNNIPFGAVLNREHKFVLPSLHGVSKAAESSLQDIPADLHFSLTNPPGTDSYPISGAVWAVFYADQEGDTGPALAKFFTWVVHDGQEFAEKMNYARLPDGLVNLVKAKLSHFDKNVAAGKSI